MKPTTNRRRVLLGLSKHGMLLITLLLCVLFSFFTRPSYPRDGKDGGEKLAQAVLEVVPAAPKVAVVTQNRPDDQEFLAALTAGLETKQGKIAAVSQGTPEEAEKMLRQLAEKGQTIDILACSDTAAYWPGISDKLGSEKTPSEAWMRLGDPKVMTPPPRRGWPRFLTLGNAKNIAIMVSVTAIIAIGMTMVIITGGIDLSVGSVVALSSVVAALLIRDGVHFSLFGFRVGWLGGSLEATPATMWISSLIAILVCGLIGLIIGLLVTTCRLPAFIVTLSFMLIAKGIAKWLTHSDSIYQLPVTFKWLGNGTTLGISNAVLLMFLLYAVAFVVMHYTVLGRYLYAVGGNSEAARLSGVPVFKVVLFAYILCSLLAGVGGIVEASRSKSGSANFGDTMELSVIAAVVVGGTSIAGGEGKILGTLVGAFMITVIRSGMNQSGVPDDQQPFVLGLVILGAVLLDKLKHWLIRRSTVTES